MKNISIILGIIISLSVVGGGIYRFDTCKASRESVEQLAGNFEVYKLEQYRRYLQERIWALQDRGQQNTDEYRRLIEELRQIDLKLKAYYQRGK